MIVVCANCGHRNDAATARVEDVLVGLTGQQLRLLNFIYGHVRDFGVAPSFDQMRDALSFKSKSNINRLIVGLEERGAIRRIPHRARAIEITPAAQKIFAPVQNNLNAGAQA